MADTNTPTANSGAAPAPAPGYKAGDKAMNTMKDIPMEVLIAAPFTAAAVANKMLMDDYWGMVQKIAFSGTDDSKTRTVTFNVARSVEGSDGNVSEQPLKVDVPILCLIPIPSLFVTHQDVEFSMHIHSFQNKSDTVSANLGFHYGFGTWGVKGGISNKYNQIQQSTIDSKYDIHVQATQHPVTTGMSKLTSIFTDWVNPLSMNNNQQPSS